MSEHAPTSHQTAHRIDQELVYHRSDELELVRELLRRNNEIARQLHHDPVQLLSTLNLKLQRLLRLTDLTTSHLVDELIDLTRDTMSSLHRIESLLAPKNLDSFGLAAALVDVTELMPDTNLIVEVDGNADDAPSEIELIAYWIGHATITHAAVDPNCTNAKVTLRCDEVALRLDLHLETPHLSQPLPLEHLQRLAASIGGTCELSNADNGVAVSIELPLF